MILFFLLCLVWLCLVQGYSINCLKCRVALLEKTNNKDSSRQVEVMQKEYLTLAKSLQSCAALICDMAKLTKNIEIEIAQLKTEIILDDKTVIN